MVMNPCEIWSSISDADSNSLRIPNYFGTRCMIIVRLVGISIARVQEILAKNNVELDKLKPKPRKFSHPFSGDQLRVLVLG